VKREVRSRFDGGAITSDAGGRQRAKRIGESEDSEKTANDPKSRIERELANGDTNSSDAKAPSPTLKAYVEDGILAAYPAARRGRFVVSGKPEHKAQAMEPAEVERFLAEAKESDPEMYPLFMTALHAGLCLGRNPRPKVGRHPIGKTESDPDRFLMVEHRWYRGRWSTPKGGKPCRVDLSKELRSVLLELRDPRILEAFARHGERASISEELVFHDRNGSPVRARKVVETHFLPVLERAGPRRFRFHDLRHTFGSLLIETGAPLPYVRDQMGHSSIQVTADQYVHLIPCRNVQFIDRLCGLF
jgi:integrase